MTTLSEAQRIELTSLREERGLSYGQLAARFGVTESAAQYHCITAGALTPRRRPACSRGPRIVACRDGRTIRRFTAEEDARLLDLAAQGHGPKRIARMVGRASSSVRMRLANLALYAEGLTPYPLAEGPGLVGSSDPAGSLTEARA